VELIAGLRADEAHVRQTGGTLSDLRAFLTVAHDHEVYRRRDVTHRVDEPADVLLRVEPADEQEP
jgi:hypothetical protein